MLLQSWGKTDVDPKGGIKIDIYTQKVEASNSTKMYLNQKLS